MSGSAVRSRRLTTSGVREDVIERQRIAGSSGLAAQPTRLLLEENLRTDAAMRATAPRR